MSVYDFDTEREIQFKGPGVTVGKFAVSPDGTQLVAKIDRNRLTVYDVSTSQPLITLLSSSKGLHDVDWSADGRRIAAILPHADGLHVWTLPQGP